MTRTSWSCTPPAWQGAVGWNVVCVTVVGMEGRGIKEKDAAGSKLASTPPDWQGEICLKGGERYKGGACSRPKPDVMELHPTCLAR